MPQSAQLSEAASSDRPFRIVRQSLAELPGFETDNHLEAFAAFRRSAEAVSRGGPPLRAARPPDRTLRELCDLVISAPLPGCAADARGFFENHFSPFRIEPGEDSGCGFVTGYYEPVVAGRFERTAEFVAPVLRRPAHFQRLGPGVAARPYPPRATIEADAEEGRYPVLVWLRDWVDVFFLQVQGSGRVTLPDRRVIRLVYDGRNGQPYTSIGRILVEAGDIASADMSLGRLKTWLRAHGQHPGQRGAT